MTGARTQISLDDAAVQAAFARLAALAVDQAPVLREIGDNLTYMRGVRFTRGQGPNRVPWKAKKERKDGKNQTLVVSGDLRDTLAWRLEGASVLIGSMMPYAAIHEFGGEIKQAPPPRVVAFRRFKETTIGADGSRTTRQRFQFARMKGSKAHKRVETRQISYGARLLKIPARPFLAGDDEDRQEIDNIIARHIARAIGGGGPA